MNHPDRDQTALLSLYLDSAIAFFGGLAFLRQSAEGDLQSEEQDAVIGAMPFSTPDEVLRSLNQIENINRLFTDPELTEALQQACQMINEWAQACEASHALASEAGLSSYFNVLHSILDLAEGMELGLDKRVTRIKALLQDHQATPRQGDPLALEDTTAELGHDTEGETADSSEACSDDGGALCPSSDSTGSDSASATSSELVANDTSSLPSSSNTQDQVTANIEPDTGESQMQDFDMEPQPEDQSLSAHQEQDEASLQNHEEASEPSSPIEPTDDGQASTDSEEQPSTIDHGVVEGDNEATANVEDDQATASVETNDQPMISDANLAPVETESSPELATQEESREDTTPLEANVADEASAAAESLAASEGTDEAASEPSAVETAEAVEAVEVLEVDTHDTDGIAESTEEQDEDTPAVNEEADALDRDEDRIEGLVSQEGALSQTTETLPEDADNPAETLEATAETPEPVAEEPEPVVTQGLEESSIPEPAESVSDAANELEPQPDSVESIVEQPAEANTNHETGESISEEAEDTSIPDDVPMALTPEQVAAALSGGAVPDVSAAEPVAEAPEPEVSTSEAMPSEDDGPMALTPEQVAAALNGGDVPDMSLGSDEGSAAGDMDAPQALTPEQMAALMSGGDVDFAETTEEDSGPQSLSAEDMAALMETPGSGMSTEGESWGTQPLMMDESEIEKIQFLAVEMHDHIDQIAELSKEVKEPTSRADACAALLEIADSIESGWAEFEFESFLKVVTALRRIARGLTECDDVAVPELVIRLMGIHMLFEQFTSCIEVGMCMSWPTKKLLNRIKLLVSGQGLHPELWGWHKDDPEQVLYLDGVMESFDELPNPPVDHDPDYLKRLSEETSETKSSSSNANRRLQIEYRQIEQLMDATSVIATTRNRLNKLLQDTFSEFGVAVSSRPELNSVLSELERGVYDLQNNIMSTKSQRLSKLLDRLPRVVRDVARLSDKEIEMETAGGEVEVDRIQADMLNDPITQVLRFIAKTSVESPNVREANGKLPQAHVDLQAEHQGSCILITVQDNGAIDFDQIRERARRAGLDWPEDLTSTQDARFTGLLSHRDIEPGLATAMRDMESQSGKIEIKIKPDGGTMVTLRAPVSSAVLGCLLVRAKTHYVCIPTQSIDQIIVTEEMDAGSVQSKPVIRYREHVIQAVDLASTCEASLQGQPLNENQASNTFSVDGQSCVVLFVNGERLAVTVDEVLGTREIMVMPLDQDMFNDSAFNCGTIGDNGEVWLIMDPIAFYDGLGQTTDPAPAVKQAA